jgi:threonine synthase
MEELLIKNRVGKTPLIRAKNLENHFGIKNIYLKMEGNNPSGHREDRLAYLIIRDALARKKNTICMGTWGTVAASLSMLAENFNIKCVFFVPSKNKILRKNLFTYKNVEIIEHGRKYEHCVAYSRKKAEEMGWYDANPGLSNNFMNTYAFSYIANELTKQVKNPIDTVFCQTSNGSSISGLHLGFKQLWINEEIKSIPKINAAAAKGGNSIIESYINRSDLHSPLKSLAIKESKFNRHMINQNAFNGQDALNAVYDTQGKALGIDDKELIAAAEVLKKLEKVRLTQRNAYSIAAFIKDAQNKRLDQGNHVIILNDGRLDINIKEITLADINMEYQDFLKMLDSWLMSYSDPLDEMDEAVKNAFEKGHVLCAFDAGKPMGMAILSRSNFNIFFPSFHLSYIATRDSAKGMGIATQLLQAAADICKGSLSLHVDIENKRAIRLYEKMGFKRKYFRMIYKNPV